MKTPDGKETDVDILLLDSEGLGSSGRSYDVAVKIFALSVVLSSNLIYNQIGNIGDQAWENLSIL